MAETKSETGFSVALDANLLTLQEGRFRIVGSIQQGSPSWAKHLAVLRMLGADLSSVQQGNYSAVSFELTGLIPADCSIAMW